MKLKKNTNRKQSNSVRLQQQMALEAMQKVYANINVIFQHFAIKS